MTSAVAELATLELARNVSETHEHDRCGQTADKNTDHRNGGTSKEEMETSEADMTPDTRWKADVTDDKKAKTHSLPVRRGRRRQNLAPDGKETRYETQKPCLAFTAARKP
eukprot:2182094-Pleurochrysis_carterae.AAC.1